MSPAQKLVRVERQRAIRAAPHRVYQLLSRVEGHPRFADLWLTADVLEHGGGQVIAEFRGYFAGLPVDSVQRVQLRPPARLEFRQLRGSLKALRGEYVIERDGAGARLIARMEVEAGIPLLEEAAVRAVLTTALDRFVGKVKDAAERDLPRLIPRRPAAVSAGALETEPAAVEGEDSGAAQTEPSGTARESAPEQVEVAQTESASDTPMGEASPPRREDQPGGAPARPRRRRRRRRRRRVPGSVP
ncbi:MAG TPA: SRPBCC family protein [bacterium]|nr:SRPBCC family protein [bacterium]